jgi:hypothetical protein
MRGNPELNAMARRVIDANHYMTLATLDLDGRPRLSPEYYTAARYTDFYWVSSPQAHHSRNLAEHPEVQIVIFDSTAPVGRGEAVYLRGVAKQIADEELEPVLPEAFRTVDAARLSMRISSPAARRCAFTWIAQHLARSTCPAVTRSTATESTPASQLTHRPEQQHRRT